MYTAVRPLSITPHENEIRLILSTKDFPLPPSPNSQYRTCNLSFPLTPALQFSNCKWLIGLKGLTIPNRIKNFNSSFKMYILNHTAVSEVVFSDARLLTAKQIVDFLNSEIAKQSSYGSNIKFGVSTGMVTCQLTRPDPQRQFAVSFSKNLATLLGFDVNTSIFAANPPAPAVKASRGCDPFVDFKLIDIKCSDADGFSTSQMPSQNESDQLHHPETSIGLVQICGNYPIDDYSVLSTPSTSKTSANLYSVSIPFESVVFYPISAQTLHSVNIKLFSLSGRLISVDTSLPVVLQIILRKADHHFV